MDNHWQAFWFKQSKQFFDTANEHLKDIFKEKSVDPNDYLDEINEWLADFQKKWQATFTDLSSSEPISYLTTLNKIFNQTTKLFIKKWAKKNKGKNPIENMIGLYELWIASCQEAFKKYQETEDYQNAYAELIHSAIQFWKTNSFK